MADRQFAERLAQEIEDWRAEGLVSDDQARALLARSGRAADNERGSRVAVGLAFLGATLLGLGVILLLASNWRSTPAALKLACIFAALIAAYALGYWLRYEKEGLRGTGNAILFLGALLFGAAIFLIAQGFHVNADEPALLVLWAAGVLPMAYLLGSRAMVVLTGLNLAVALGWEASFWLDESNSAGRCLAVFVTFGVLLYALGSLHGMFDATRPFRLPYCTLGLVVMLLMLFPLTFPDLEKSSLTAGAGPLPSGALLRYGILAGLAGSAVLANLVLPRRPSRTTFPEIAALAGMLVVAIFLFAHGTGSAILFNLLLFALTIGTAAAGYWNREPAWINTGTLFFALLVIVRYFDWFWKLMPRSLFFIGGGLLLLLGGVALERTRRRLVDAALVTAAAPPPVERGAPPRRRAAA